MKVKELIRRILLAPFYLVASPMLWLVMNKTSYKEVWEEFIDITEDGTSLWEI